MKIFTEMPLRPLSTTKYMQPPSGKNRYYSIHAHLVKKTDNTHSVHSQTK